LISEFGVRFPIAAERLTSSMETLSAHDQRRFRLGDGELAPDGVRRIARGQLDMSLERLEGDTDEDLGTAVHETRKSLKRLRATVRLARDELGDESYRRENVAFRDAGRRLGAARDSRVLLETFDALIDRYRHEAPPERFERFKRTLVGQHGAAQRRLHEGAAIDEVVGELRRARARVGTGSSSGKALRRWLRASSGSTAAAAARTAPPARSRAPRTCTICASARSTCGTRRRSSGRPRRRR
jgi:CHAD domain